MARTTVFKQGREMWRTDVGFLDVVLYCVDLRCVYHACYATFTVFIEPVLC